MSSNEEKIIRVKSKDDHDAVRLVNADAGDRLEWNKLKRDEEEVDRLPPVPGALSRLYRLFPQLQEELAAVFVRPLKARRRVREHFLINVCVQESSFHV